MYVVCDVCVCVVWYDVWLALCGIASQCCVGACVEMWLALLCGSQCCHSWWPTCAGDCLSCAPIRVRIYWASVLEREEVFSYVFHQMLSVETANPLRVWKRGLSYFRGTCESLSLRPASACVFRRVLLSFLQWPQRQKATGNLRSRGQPSIRRRPSCLSCISGKDLPCAVQGVIVLSAWTSLCVAQWRRDNRIDYPQGDYDILRRLPKTSWFCDV